MIPVDAPRAFAIEVVQKLQAAGYEALFAGGCVRDHLMGDRPKDYDVATNARPDDIRDIFGRGRTLAIGESFGVVSVLGPRAAGQIDVATFRQDAKYSDGRHPDSVTYSTAERDAQRRDFTINGLFYDPLTDRVLDFVGGQADLQAKIIRAIGNPDERIAEDRLRMLRAVRFAARLGFVIEPATLAAIRRAAAGIVQISGERIANEMRWMLASRQRAAAWDDLCRTNLLAQVIPERFAGNAGSNESLARVRDAWSRLEGDSFAVALAIAVYDLPNRENVVAALSRRWRLSKAESHDVDWIGSHLDGFLDAHRRPWPQVQRELIYPLAEDTLRAAAAVAPAWSRPIDGLEFCRQRLAWPGEQLNPCPLIDGYDLREINISAGPIVGRILEAVRDRQLSGAIHTREEALAYARSMAQ